MNNKKYRNTEFITYLQRKYNHGKLLDDSDWIKLADMARTVDSVFKKADYIKGQTTIKRFLVNDLEDFQILSDCYNRAIKSLINLEDYFSDDADKEEAHKIIEEVFGDLQKIKEDNEQYFSSVL